MSAFVSRVQEGNISMITFNTLASFQLPDSLISCSISQFQNVLTFASKLIGMEESLVDEYTRTSLFAEYLKDIEQKHSKEKDLLVKESISDITSKIGPLVSKFQQQDEAYNQKLSDIKSEYEHQLKALQKLKLLSESELTTSKSEMEAVLKKEVKALSKKATDLEAELQATSKSESLIRDRCKEEADRILKVHEEKYRELIAMKEECLSQREQKVIAKEEELQSKIHRSASSVLRGQDGEHFFKNLAKEKMNWELTKAPTFSCDYSATINTVQVLFEIKNYTHAVKSEEINKFLRDMKLHPEALVGIFISLNTNIQGRNPNIPIAIEWINGSQCAIYIQSCADLDIDYTMSIIDQVVRITNTFNTVSLSQNMESKEPIFQARIEQAKGHLERTVSRGVKLMKKISADKKQQIELIEANSVHSLSELKYQNADISTSIQILLGEYSEPTNDIEIQLPEVELTIIEDKPKKTPTKKSTGAGAKAVKIEAKSSTGN